MDDMQYGVLEAQWEPLMRKFSSWSVPNMDHEDIMQEMRIVLLKSQRRFDESKNTKFFTFFYTSCLNKMLKLLRDSGMGNEPRQKWVPPYQMFPLCDGEHRSGASECGRCTGYELNKATHEAEGLSDLDLVNIFGGMSDDAKWLIGLIARESVTTRSQDRGPRWSKSMALKVMGRKRFKQGIKELKVVLKGGLS